MLQVVKPKIPIFEISIFGIFGGLSIKKQLKPCILEKLAILSHDLHSVVTIQLLWSQDKKRLCRYVRNHVSVPQNWFRALRHEVNRGNRVLP